MPLLKIEVEEARNAMEVKVNTQANEVFFRILIVVVKEKVDVMNKEEETTTSTQTINSVSIVWQVWTYCPYMLSLFLYFLSRKPD